MSRLILWLWIGLLIHSSITRSLGMSSSAEPELIIPLNEDRKHDPQSSLHSEFSALKTSLKGFGAELERFQGLHLKTIDSKIIQIFTAITNLDSNLKAQMHIQEIFKHHVNAWTDYMKSIDKKIDLVKRAQDTSFTLEAKVTALEQKSLHIYEKVDMINEKMHDMLKILYNQKVEHNCDPVDFKDVNGRIANIEKQITLIQNNHCKNTPRRLRHNNHDFVNSPLSNTYQSVDQRDLSKEIKQMLAVTKKTFRNIEYIGDSIQYLNDTTERFHKSLDEQHVATASCCRSNEARISHLTEYVESSFQKLERIYLNLENNIKAIRSGNNNETVCPSQPGTTALEEPASGIRGYDDEDVDASGSGSGDKELLNKSIPTSHRTRIRQQKFRSGCHEVKEGAEDGVYSFGFTENLNDLDRDFNQRFCHFGSDGIGWTVIQRRGDFEKPREDFNRSWSDYKMGFGDLEKEFWYGNDYIHKLTNDEGQMELRIELEDFNGTLGVVKYSRFYVSSERLFYRLDVQGYDGNVSDSLLYHNQMPFSAFDSANDNSRSIPCGHASGWWFNNCLESNLNGKYFDYPFNSSYTGIIWEHWLGDYSLKGSTMMIRPVSTTGLWIDGEDDEPEEERDYDREAPLVAPPEDP